MTSWERFRRARARPNEATHPVELPDLADEAAFYAARARTNAREEELLLREGADVGTAAELTRRAVGRRVRAGEEHEFEYVRVTSEGQFFITVPEGLIPLRPDQVEDVCHVCEEPGTGIDPLGHFRDPGDLGEYVIAHGECGHGHGLELA